MHRPIGVTILALLSALAGLMASVHALQYLHILPFNLGSVAFYGFDPLGALMWGISAIIWGWATVNLWMLRPQALQFVAILAGLNLILDALSILGASTLSAMLPSMLFNAAVLVYSMNPRARAAFGMP